MTESGGGGASPPPESLRFYLLGDFRATLEGADLPHPPYRSLPLLAALLLQPAFDIALSWWACCSPKWQSPKGDSG